MKPKKLRRMFRQHEREMFGEIYKFVRPKPRLMPWFVFRWILGWIFPQ